MKFLNLCLLLCVLTSCLPTKKESKGRVLFVVTSHSDLGGSGKKTGAYITEVTHPYEVLSDAGYEIDFVSPKGGETPLDGMDQADEMTEKLLQNKKFKSKLHSALKPEHIDPSKYKAVFFAGGHGTMFDLPDHKKFQEITAKIYEKGGAVAAVCHGPVALVNTKLSNGEYLIKGKEVAAFTNEEEEAVGLTQEMPFLLESKMIERGAKHTKVENFKEHVVVSERLVTGQNPASAKKVGEKILELLKTI